MTTSRTPKTPTKTINKLSGLARFDASWKSWTLRNGLRCLHVPLPPRDERYHIIVMIHSGSRDEPADKAGISHLLEHMMFRGSAKYPSFSSLSEAFEDLGGEWNAATGHEYTEFYYSGTSDKATEACELLADFLLRPALQDLDTERRIVLRELEGELNENGVSTDIDFHVLRALWPDTSMAMPIIGTEKSLASIKVEHLKDWMTRRYQAKNMVICIVGGKAGDAKKLTRANFSKFPRRSNDAYSRNIAPPSFKGPRCDVIDNADSEFDIQVSFTCEGTRSALTSSYDLLSRALADGFSSRLVRRIREELGLVYDISADFHQYDGMGTFNINASVSEANIETFFSELFAILDAVKSNGITNEELARHKNRAFTDLQLVPTDPAHIGFRISWSLLAGTDPRLHDWRSKIDQITVDELRVVAGQLFQPSRMAVAALGPTNKEITARFHACVNRWTSS